jgi:hypothetical protein
MKIVHVEWIDAALYVDGWTSSHEDASLLKIDTVGFLLYEDENVIKVAQSNCAESKFIAIQSIPKDGIIKVKRISG